MKSTLDDFCRLAQAALAKCTFAAFAANRGREKCALVGAGDAKVLNGEVQEAELALGLPQLRVPLLLSPRREKAVQVLVSKPIHLLQE